jgi:hypothetical protein
LPLKYLENKLMAEKIIKNDNAEICAESFGNPPAKAAK